MLKLFGRTGEKTYFCPKGFINFINAKSMKIAVWLSYDLGITGDYTGLYRWLDTHHGIECGNSTSFIKFEYREDFLTEIKSSMEEFVET